MGLFTGLLTLPLAPVRGVVWVAEQVAQEADRQLYDEDRIRPSSCNSSSMPKRAG